MLGVGTTIIAGALETLDPLFMRHLIDVALPRKQLLGSLLTVLLIAFCYVGRSGLGGLGVLHSFRVAQLLGQDLRIELLGHMTVLSSDWHDRTFLGEKLSRIEKDVEQISQLGSEIANSVLRAVIFFLVNLAIMFALNWRMTLSVLPLLPLFFWIRERFHSDIQMRAERAQAEIGKATGSLTEHLGAIPQIQILGAEEARILRTTRAWIEVLDAQWAQRRMEVAFSICVTSVLTIAVVIVLGLGAHEYMLRSLTLGGLIAFYAYVTRIFEPVSTAMELYSRTQRMVSSARRVREVLETEPTVRDNGSIKQGPSPLVFGLSCEEVSFGYSSAERVLHEVSFRIGHRERIAIIGKSGSGKSTLSRLLARMADPDLGRVLLERRPASEYTLQTLRRTVCYVPQQPVLFSGTIRENLLYANANATESDIQKAIEAAQLLPVLRRLPRGLDTTLGPEATGLSGGERQRLALARALLRNAAILVLDESTSALDVPTEQAVFQSIANYDTHMALVLISHRLRALTWVDRIVMLDMGRIVAEGTHAVLYSESALYRKLFDRDEQIEDDSPDEQGADISFTSNVLLKRD
jgi:ABC-type multidrug transport system fused ATPase/permease subunit